MKRYLLLSPIIISALCFGVLGVLWSSDPVTSQETNPMTELSKVQSDALMAITLVSGGSQNATSTLNQLSRSVDAFVATLEQHPNQTAINRLSGQVLADIEKLRNDTAQLQQVERRLVELRETRSETGLLISQYFQLILDAEASINSTANARVKVPGVMASQLFSAVYAGRKDLSVETNESIVELRAAATELEDEHGALAARAIQRLSSAEVLLNRIAQKGKALAQAQEGHRAREFLEGKIATNLAGVNTALSDIRAELDDRPLYASANLQWLVTALIVLGAISALGYLGTQIVLGMRPGSDRDQGMALQESFLKSLRSTVKDYKAGDHSQTVKSRAMPYIADEINELLEYTRSQNDSGQFDIQYIRNQSEALNTETQAKIDLCRQTYVVVKDSQRLNQKVVQISNEAAQTIKLLGQFKKVGGKGTSHNIEQEKDTAVKARAKIERALRDLIIKGIDTTEQVQQLSGIVETLHDELRVLTQNIYATRISVNDIKSDQKDRLIALLNEVTSAHDQIKSKVSELESNVESLSSNVIDSQSTAEDIRTSFEATIQSKPQIDQVQQNVSSEELAELIGRIEVVHQVAELASSVSSQLGQAHENISDIGSWASQVEETTSNILNRVNNQSRVGAG